MRFPIFELERVQSIYENTVEYNLTESGFHPFTLAELLKPEQLETLQSTVLGYGQTNGSPAVRERIAALYPGLDTGDPKTVYLFNFMKGKILEYRRDIVEVKLRELETEELAMAPELRKAYKEVRETFEPRTVKPRRAVFRARPEPALDEVPDTDDDFGLDTEIPLITDTDDEGAPSDLFG